MVVVTRRATIFGVTRLPGLADRAIKGRAMCRRADLRHAVAAGADRALSRAALPDLQRAGLGDRVEFLGGSIAGHAVAAADDFARFGTGRFGHAVVIVVARKLVVIRRATAIDKALCPGRTGRIRCAVAVAVAHSLAMGDRGRAGFAVWGFG